MLRSILNIKLKDKISINKIKSKTNCKDIGYHIKKFKFKYAGHVARGDKNKWNLTVTQWIPRDDKRRRGRAPTRWVDELIRYVCPQ